MVDITNADKCRGRRESIKNATPSWLSEEDRLHMERFYEVSAAMSVGDTKYEVDHIIPISKGGLHHEDNLQYLTIAENRRKSDKLIW